MTESTVYLNDEHNTVPPEKTTHIVTTETDEHGRVICETWNKPPSARPGRDVMLKLGAHCRRRFMPVIRLLTAGSLSLAAGLGRALFGTAPVPVLLFGAAGLVATAAGLIRLRRIF